MIRACMKVPLIPSLRRLPHDAGMLLLVLMLTPLMVMLQACTMGTGSSPTSSDLQASMAASSASQAVASTSSSAEIAASEAATAETAASEAAVPEVAAAEVESSEADASDHAAVIDKALDEITSSPLESSNTEDYIEAHPEAVQAVLAIGDEALPLLAAVYDNGDRGLRGGVAVSLCTRIHQGLNRVESISPDGRFRAETYGIMTSISSAGLYPAEGIRLVEQDTGKVVWNMEPGYYMTSFLWSADSRYVAVYYMARIYGTAVVVDTQTMTSVELPTQEALQAATKEDITQRDFRPDPYLEPIRWLDDARLEIKFTWIGTQEQDIMGQFVFRVADGGVENLAIH